MDRCGVQSDDRGLALQDDRGVVSSHNLHGRVCGYMQKLSQIDRKKEKNIHVDICDEKRHFYIRIRDSRL